MKRRSVIKALALVSSLIMLSGEVMPAFAAGASAGDVQVVEAAADEETTEEEGGEATGEETVSEDAAVSEDEAVSENKAVSENDAASENAAEDEELSDDEEGEEDEVLEATPESDFDWNGTIITKYKGSAAKVVIPAKTTQIGKNAFKDSSVTSVTFEDVNGVIRIGESAFNGCAGLAGFVIPSSVKMIGGYAFKGCTSLTEVTLPDNVALGLSNSSDYVTGRGVFMNCTSLKKVKNVTGGIVVNDNNFEPPFQGCSALTDIEFASGATSVPYELFSKCTAIKTVTIPASVDVIDKDAFYGCTSLTDVIFESGTKLNKIGESAFNGCSRLSNFNIPSSVKLIGGYAFKGCTSLTEVTLPDNVALGKNDSGNYITGRGVFMNCTSLKKVKNVTGGIVVNDNNFEPPFQECSALTDIEFASGATSVPYELFSMCTAIKTVTIPATVNVIDKDAFYGCTSLTDVIFESGTKLNKIGESAFNGCSRLSNFSIPSSVKLIGGYAFKGCTSLTEVTLPDNVALGKNDSSNYITGRGVFMNCTSLKKVRNVTGGIVVNDNNFEPPFQGCTSLTEIEFAQGIKKIPVELFSKCVALRSVTFPNTVTSIEKFAFDGCAALREIHLPSKLKSVKESAFRDCVSITEVYYGGKSTREKIKKASEKNNDPLFAVEWIKESRSDEPKTGNLTLDGNKVNSLAAAFKQMKDKDKEYVIELQSDLIGEKNLTIPKTAKSVRIIGNGHVVEINGTKLTSNVLLKLEDVKFRTVNKKGLAKFTINGKDGLIIGNKVLFDTAGTTVRSAKDLTVNGTLDAKTVNCRELSLIGVIKAKTGGSIKVKDRLSGYNSACRIELEEGYKPIDLGGIAEGTVNITGAKQAQGTPVIKASAKKISEDTLKKVFNVGAINTANIASHLYYYNGKACIFSDAISYNGKTYGVWKSAIADMNAAQKEAKKAKTKASFTVTLNGDVNMMGKFLLPSKGYESITINGGGHAMIFTSDITLTGNTAINSTTLKKVNKKNEQVAGKVKKGKFSYTGPETF